MPQQVKIKPREYCNAADMLREYAEVARILKEHGHYYLGRSAQETQTVIERCRGLATLLENYGR